MNGRGPSAAYLHSVGLAPVPAYPAGELAGPLADLVASSGLPAPLLGAAGLGVLAVLAAHGEVILPGGGTQRPALWIPAIAPTGGAKTPTLDGHVMAPLRDLEAAVRGERQRDMRDWQAAASRREERGDRPPDTALTVRNFTIEGLARILNRRRGGCALIYADELATVLKRLGEYKKGGGSDRDEFIDLWNARDWLIQRVANSRDEDLGLDIYIPRTCVTVLGGIQPGRLDLLGDDASGMRARWLPHYSDLSPVPFSEWSEQGRAAWTETVTRMYILRQIARRWEFSEKAKALWRSAQQRWKADDRTELNASARAALKKADIHAARVALVIAASMEEGTGASGIIGGSAMRAAIAIVDYALDVFRCLQPAGTFALTSRDEKAAAKAEELRAWLEETPNGKAGRRALLRGHVAGVRNKDDLDTLRDEYKKTYPGCVRSEDIRGNWTEVFYAPSHYPG